MIKFGFKIKTRGGTVVDHLMIAARDRADAERKVNQIYHHCEFLECHEAQPPLKEEALDLERAINLITREPGPDSAADD